MPRKDISKGFEYLSSQRDSMFEVRVKTFDQEAQMIPFKS